MVLNTAGRMVQWQWNDLPHHFRNTELNECMVMPNHLYGIIPNVAHGCKQILFSTQSRKERKGCQFIYPFLCELGGFA
ncbi:MAG: hypothetical protein ACE5HX_10990, partial [bacterium]